MTVTADSQVKLDLTHAQRTVIEARYLARDPETGEICETPEDMMMRIAQHIASAEENMEERTHWCTVFANMLLNFEFLPNTPCIVHSGRDLGMLAACFVLPIDDSIDSIYQCVKEAAIVHKGGGGTGFDFSKIRPRNDIVATTGHVASGPVSFMRVIDAGTEAIKQGSTRRGANMGILRCLAGDTTIHTIGGRYPIKSLVGMNPILYTTDGKGQVFAERAAKVWRSGRNRKLVRVHLDNDTHIDCTPDHRFMLSDGTWEEAQNLETADSLMILKKALETDGYRYVYIPKEGNPRYSDHRLIAEEFYGPIPEGHEVHHINGIRHDNYPSNLQILSKSEHAKTHSSRFLKKEQERITKARKGKTLEEWKEKARDYRQKMSNSARKRSSWNAGITGEDYRAHYPDGFKNQHSNHKVAWVEELDGQHEVFDIQMLTHHNFVANEVFVHNCDHPDIMEFLECKTVEGKVANFNISVGITDEFMDAVKEDKAFHLKFNGQIYSTVAAKMLFDKLAECAWKLGDPGVVFLDKMNQDNYTRVTHGPIGATNPCGEQPLHSYDSCTLGSINIAKFIKLKKETVVSNVGNLMKVKDVARSITFFDWDGFRECIHNAVRFLDNVIELNNYPLLTIKERTLQTRRIGLGVMGFADALRELRLDYDGENGREFAESIMSTVYWEAAAASEMLAAEKGAFPLYSEVSEYLGREESREGLHIRAERLAENPRRNSHLTTIAPTGSISMVAGCSQGIEPLFAKETVHKVLPTPDHPEGQEIRRPVRGSQHFKTANEIAWGDHIRMQARFQMYNDSACSKTINMPNSATVQDVRDAFLMAWNEGCKGITIYRDGSREHQVLNDASKVVESSELSLSPNGSRPHPVPKPRPAKLPGYGYKVPVRAGSLLVDMYGSSEKPQEPFEVKVTIGKSSAVVHSLSEALGRLCSLWLRAGGEPEYLIKQLVGIGDGTYTRWNGYVVTSIPDAVARILMDHLACGEQSTKHPDLAVEDYLKCPECGGEIAFSSGCETCTVCAHSKCG